MQHPATHLFCLEYDPKNPAIFNFLKRLALMQPYIGNIILNSHIKRERLFDVNPVHRIL